MINQILSAAAMAQQNESMKKRFEMERNQQGASMLAQLLAGASPVSTPEDMPMDLSKGPRQGMMSQTMSPYLNPPMAQQRPMMPGLGSGLATTFSQFNTPEGLESIGNAKLNEQPSRGIGNEAGWGMMLLSALAGGLGARDQDLGAFLGGIGSQANQRLQKEENVRQQQAKFAFNRAEQLRTKMDKDSANQTKGAGLLLDAAQAKTPQEAQILMDEAARIMGKRPTANQALGIMDNVTATQQRAEEDRLLRQRVSEANLENMKRDDEFRAEQKAITNIGKEFKAWYDPIKSLAVPPSGDDLIKLKADYDAMAARAAEVGATLPPFEQIVAQRLGQYNAERGQQNWQEAFDFRIQEALARNNRQGVQDAIKEKERQRKLEEHKAKASEALANGATRKDPFVKEAQMQIKYRMDGWVKMLRGYDQRKLAGKATPEDAASRNAVVTEMRREYNEAAKLYGYDDPAVQQYRAMLGKENVVVANVDPSTLNFEMGAGGLAPVPKGDAPKEGAKPSFVAPLDKYVVKSHYGPRNIGGTASRNHGGIDLAVPVGTPVKAAASGVVVGTGRNVGKAGHIIVVRHADGSTTHYFHMSDIGVKPRDVIEAGQIIGKSGGAEGADGSGNSQGPHLHFEYRDSKGRKIDPRKILKFK